MAVLLETSKGDMVVDLYTEECPIACKNFLKLCKIKYYNDVLFHNIQKDFIAQTGDPTGTGKGGSSIYGVLYGDQARLFEDELHPHIRHRKKGMLGMASGGKDSNASQFYLTTADALDSLDEKRTLFGEVSEGMDVLEKVNEAFVDAQGRPLQNIRIRHTIVLDDPFEDPPQLAEHIPEKSPEPIIVEGDTRLEDDWAPDQDTRSLEEIEESNRKKEAQARAVVLEMIGDLPEADSKPPTNMLFVCKLNQATTEEDLEIIFSRFGAVTSCDIIRDFKTGDSLSYAFIGFDTDKASEEAYFKMNNVLIDDRRIKVDFSQSVSHLWRQFKVRGNTADAATGQMANSGGGGGPPGAGVGGGSGCYNCGEPGHLARECPNPRVAGGGRGCYNCGQAGHLARDCPNPKAKPGTGPAGGGNSESGNSLALKARHERAGQHGVSGRSYGLLLEDEGPPTPHPPQEGAAPSGRSRSHQEAGPSHGEHRPDRGGARNPDRGAPPGSGHAQGRDGDRGRDGREQREERAPQDHRDSSRGGRREDRGRHEDAGEQGRSHIYRGDKSRRHDLDDRRRSDRDSCQAFQLQQHRPPPALSARDGDRSHGHSRRSASLERDDRRRQREGSAGDDAVAGKKHKKHRHHRDEEEGAGSRKKHKHHSRER